jgi:hypothetical protein
MAAANELGGLWPPRSLEDLAMGVRRAFVAGLLRANDANASRESLHSACAHFGVVKPNLMGSVCRQDNRRHLH